MRILIDARLYGPKGAKGLGRYVKEIVEGLRRRDQHNHYIILLSRDNWEEFQASDRFEKVLAPWRWYTLAEQLYLPRLIRRCRPDLVHFPHFNVPLLYRGPFVVTIHDLLLRQYPSRRASTLSPWRYWLKNLAYRLVVRSAIRRARRIITVSEFTKKEILRYYSVDAARLTVIHNGLTDLSKNNSTLSDDKAVLLRYTITKPFLLYVGNAYPHKNLPALIAAFSALQPQWSGQLILVGQRDYFYEQLERDMAHASASADSIRCLGYVSDEDLAALYRAASLYVFPSLYEGFGLPALEAMHQSLPIAVSDIPGLREVCGPAAAYFNPRDTKSIAATILDTLTDTVRRSVLIAAGRQQVQRFDWGQSVADHLTIYHACIQEKKIS
ncbi:glycosyltransferase family 4 protein [Candidatus Falkowbacteria bacterium]|nr:glycosyltransferase family 4 protein [Candidatus Falkowbacteria bacterium]